MNVIDEINITFLCGWLTIIGRILNVEWNGVISNIAVLMYSLFILLDAIVEGMEERKAKNITILNISKLENRVTDYFVICDADSKTHVNSIADSVEDMVIKLTNEKAYHAEGHQNSEWILIDYINIVVHVFLRETREFYNIEGLWGDAEITTINN